MLSVIRPVEGYLGNRREQLHQFSQFGDEKSGAATMVRV